MGSHKTGSGMFTDFVVTILLKFNQRNLFKSCLNSNLMCVLGAVLAFYSSIQAKFLP